MGRIPTIEVPFAKKVAAATLTTFVLFPYVGFLEGLDTQPFALIALLAFFPFYIRLEKDLVVFMLPLFATVLHLLMFPDNFSFTYFAKSITPIATAFLLLQALRHGYINTSQRAIIVAATVYVLVAIIQRFIAPEFLTGLVSRTTDQIAILIESGRGARSLAPEPAQLGHLLTILNMFLFLIMMRKGPADKPEWLRFSIATATLFFANLVLPSSMYSVAVHGILAFAIFLLFRPFFTLFLIVPLSIYLVVIILNNFLAGSRMENLIGEFSFDLNRIFVYGAAYRLFNIPLSILGSLKFGLFGFGASDDFVHITIGGHQFMITAKNVGGLIALFLQYGIMSCFYIYLICYLVAGSIKRIAGVSGFTGSHIRFAIMYWLMVVLLCIQYGSPSNPLLWLLIMFGWSRNSYTQRYVRPTRHAIGRAYGIGGSRHLRVRTSYGECS